ncbi:MAG: methyltransferase domain-containing protein [Chloroflexota bacterium]|nr:methyltransferase domain-containing protein [Chloroflexota bacterium]
MVASLGHPGSEVLAMQRLTQVIGSNLRHPRGPMGRLTARLMRQGNASLNVWMVERLAVKPRDRVLEVGFGPGVVLAELLIRVPDGIVVGVDASELMVRQARSRHAADITAGRLELRQGDAGSLSDSDESFDVVCGTHVIYFWPDPVATVRELGRVLRPGGTLALAYQERDRMPGRAALGLSQAGARLFGPGEVENVVRAAGFVDIRTEFQSTPDGPAGFCVLAMASAG